MSYFSHAFKKTFVATKATVAASGTPGARNAQAGVTDGLLTTTGVHVANLKSTAASEGYQLGPGVVGLFDAKTNLSVLGADIATGCCPFYLAGASIKLNDKQGPFHGGYQESHKSKIINPKYMGKVWFVNGNAGSQAVLEIGNTLGNNGGAIANVNSLDATSLVPGTGYSAANGVATTGGSGTGLTVNIAVDRSGEALTGTLGAVSGTGYTSATGVATTGGTGTGLTIDITAAAGDITAATIADGGSGYTAGDVVTIAQGDGASDDETFTVATVDETGEIITVTVNKGGSGYAVGDTITISTGNADATIDVLTVGGDDVCGKEFLCGETYYLRVDVKGTPALRFANHNLYQTLQANGGCCADPVSPSAVDQVVIYKQWVQQIAENPYLKDFVNPLLVVDGQSYAYDVARATAVGLNPATKLFANAPETSTTAGIILLGAYADTTFGDCTFQVSDYYGKEPIQIYASEVDINGDPCAFGGICVVERCPGIQPNGLGEQKVRELILSESYLQNFVANDLRIREITQGTRAYEVLDRTALYDSVFIQHSVPRFNNPSGVFDNDQYLLEVVMANGTASTLTDEIQAIIDGGCTGCAEIEDFSGTDCSFSIPEVH